VGKKMIIKGVGSMLAKRITDGGSEVITLGTLQDLKITFNVELDDIFGGDGLFPIDDLVKSKSIEITASDAKFDLYAIQLMMGSSVEEDKQDTLWVLNEMQTVTSGTNGTSANVGMITLKYGSTIASNPEVTVRVNDTNKVLLEVPYATDTAPGTNSYMVAPNGVVYFDSSLVGMDVVVNYKRTATVDMASILADEVPFPVRIIHHGSFMQKDGTFKGIETELFACRAKGAFTINAQRATANASEISLAVIDPERPDGKLGTVKMYSATERV
jgi:hypothetical protein